MLARTAWDATKGAARIILGTYIVERKKIASKVFDINFQFEGAQFEGARHFFRDNASVLAWCAFEYRKDASCFAE